MIRCLLVGKCIGAESLDAILEAEFQVADTSNDGTIDWQEFVVACDHCPTVVKYFQSLEGLATHTLRKMQEAKVQASPAARTELSSRSTIKPLEQFQGDQSDAIDDSGSATSSDFGSVQNEEPAAVASAMTVAFEAAVAASRDEVDKAWQRVDEAVDTVWIL